MLLEKYIRFKLSESIQIKKNIHIDMFSNFCELTAYLNGALYNQSASHSTFKFIAGKILKKASEPISNNDEFIDDSSEFLEEINELFSLGSSSSYVSIRSSIYFDRYRMQVSNEKNINASNYLDENYSFINDSKVALEKYFRLIIYLKNTSNFNKCLNVLKAFLKSKYDSNQFNIKNERGKNLIITASNILRYFSKLNKLLEKNKKDFPVGVNLTINKVLRVVDRYLEKLPNRIKLNAQEVIKKSYLIQKKWTIFVKDIEPEDKIIYTEKSFDLSIINNLPQQVGLKPNGAWYSFGNEWDDFCKQNSFNTRKYNFKYLIEVDESKIFTISNESDLKLFESLYYVEPDSIGLDGIDWERVEKDGYFGFQIKNWDTLSNIAIKNRNTGQTWLSKYDISSGCVWNSNAILDFHDLSYKYFPDIFSRNKYELNSLETY